MDKLLIVDGMNLLFQMFYGMPSRITAGDGKFIQGTLGFIGALLKIIRYVQPTHMAVVFDGPCENVRCALDVNYKANRPDYSQMPEEETPFSQLPDIYAALDILGICHRETKCCEADDWMAAYAHEFGTQMQVIIASWDSDLWQLITDNVQILRYRGENTVLCDEAYIADKLGILPAQYADFKSLTGDPSDNIKGAEKVGPKTAAALLHRFGTLENILSHPEEISKPSIRDSICRNTERLRLNKTLILLDGAQPLPFSFDEIRWQYHGETTRQILSAIGLH